MPEELRGVRTPEDIETVRDAARLLEVDMDASEDEITDAFRDIVPLVHPDQEGTAELFKAADDARELLIATSAAGSTPGTGPGTDSPRSGAGTGTAGASPGATAGTGAAGSTAPGAGQSPGEDLVDNIEEMLRQQMTEQELRDKYFQDTEFRDVAEILASLVLSGNIDLGSLERMVSGDERFSSNIGSSTGGNFSRGGGSNFGSSGYASSNPDDFMGYGVPDDDEDDDDDDDDGPRSARGSDFGGM